MDLLRTAVVDITTMVATCHALRSDRLVEGELVLHRKLRAQLRRQLKRATVAYIDALARTRRGVVDAALLASCRIAAERQMTHAIEHQALLNRIMAFESGSLQGMAAARQDLWRLAHLAIYLNEGTAVLSRSIPVTGVKLADLLARRLRRRFRKALIAYARVNLRAKAPAARLIVAAREAALEHIGPRGAQEAERLTDIEATVDPAHDILGRGVLQPLFDLALDWRRSDPEPA